MGTYRKAHHDIPIFDHSTIMIERTMRLRGSSIKAR